MDHILPAYLVFYYCNWCAGSPTSCKKSITLLVGMVSTPLCRYGIVPEQALTAILHDLFRPLCFILAALLALLLIVRAREAKLTRQRLPSQYV